MAAGKPTLPAASRGPGPPLWRRRQTPISSIIGVSGRSIHHDFRAIGSASPLQTGAASRALGADFPPWAEPAGTGQKPNTSRLARLEMLHSGLPTAPPSACRGAAKPLPGACEGIFAPNARAPGGRDCIVCPQGFPHSGSRHVPPIPQKLAIRGPRFLRIQNRGSRHFPFSCSQDGTDIESRARQRRPGCSKPPAPPSPHVSQGVGCEA
jgi:hypothetical protein